MSFNNAVINDILAQIPSYLYILLRWVIYNKIHKDQKKLRLTPRKYVLVTKYVD